MGILTRLRNAFGRSRKSRTAEAEGAARTATAGETGGPEGLTSEDTGRDATAAPASPPATDPKVPSPSPEPNPTPSANVPEPRTSDSGEHDLVSLAFDHVTVPRPTRSTEGEQGAAEDRAAAEEPAVAEKATAAEEPAAAEKTAAAEEPAVVAEPTAVEEPEAAESAVAEKATDAEAAPAETPVAEEAESTTPEKPEAGPADEAQAEPAAKTDAKAEAAPEPQAEAEPKPEAEPATDTKPKAKAEPATDTKPKPEPKAKAKAEPATDTKPEPEPKATRKAAPKAEAGETAKATKATKATKAAKATKGTTGTTGTTGTKSEKAPEPAAADGDTAPQGPPAPGDESRTGGAGGKKNTAEAAGEAEPALTLTALKKHAPGLTTAYKAATTTLEKNNLTGTRAKVYLVLDRSASMRPYYKDGSAQALAEQTLALAAHLDPEATVPVVFFSTELDGTGEITLTDHENKIDELHASLGRMGRTSYHAAVEAVLAHHDKTAAAPGTPALVVFQTDGAPDAKTPATQALTDAAKTHPAVFFSFVAFGDPENKAFDYLRKLKTPNTSHFLAGETPRELTDKELYEGVLANWRP
ncbi:VWA domain-containing protein [Streptomyces paradoxus]|uniref:VWA domain-containing protein n=1 Tax=Streptomyces paradoxus TaxID=66375 RepID=UPI00362B32D0